MKKVLISAYACAPSLGSEAAVGWSWLSRISKMNLQIHCFVEKAEFESKIKIWLANNPSSELHKVNWIFVYRQRSRLLEAINYDLGNYMSLCFWHIKVFFDAYQRHRNNNYDIIHHLNMIGFREPGFLWLLRGSRYVHGPVGGGGLITRESRKLLPKKSQVYYKWYNTINRISKSLGIRFVLAKICAGDRMLYANSENYEFFNAQKGAIYIPADILQRPKLTRQSKEKSVVWIGNFEDRKLLPLFIDIFRNWRDAIDFDSIEVYGEYSGKNNYSQLDLDEIESSFKAYGINFCFRGKISNERLLERLRKVKVHVFTSIREGTPISIAESASMGVKVVCFGHSGMKDMLDSKYFVDVEQNYEEIVNDYRRKILEAISSDENQNTSFIMEESYRQNTIKSIYGL